MLQVQKQRTRHVRIYFLHVCFSLNRMIRNILSSWTAWLHVIDRFIFSLIQAIFRGKNCNENKLCSRFISEYMCVFQPSLKERCSCKLKSVLKA